MSNKSLEDLEKILKTNSVLRRFVLQNFFKIGPRSFLIYKISQLKMPGLLVLIVDGNSEHVAHI